jgi:hypothetical protein
MAARSFSSVMVETSRAGPGTGAGLEEEALGLAFPEAIGNGFRGGSRRIRGRFQIREKGDLKRDGEELRKAWAQR